MGFKRLLTHFFIFWDHRVLSSLNRLAHMRVSDFIPRFVKLSDLQSRIVEVEWLHIHFYFVAVEKHIQKLKIESTNYQSLII